MVEMFQLFGVLGQWAGHLLTMEVAGFAVHWWFKLFWLIAVVGWLLRIMYGQQMK